MQTRHTSTWLLMAIGLLTFQATARTEPDNADSGAKSTKRSIDMSDIPPDAKAEEVDLAELGEGFKTFRTAHASILHNVSDQDVKSFSLAIERTYRSCLNYAMSLGIEPKKPKHKLLIYYFDLHEHYNAHSIKLRAGERPQSVPGFYLPSINRSMFYNYRNQESFRRVREEAERSIKDLQERLRTAKTADERKSINRQITQAKAQMNASNTQGGDINEGIVQHEVAHHILWSIGFHNSRAFITNPRWFAEGTAMMFETVSTGKSGNIGAVNKNRLKDFRDLEKAGRLIPLREFVSTADYFNQSQELMGIAYAQSWAVAHYLNRTKRDRIKNYVETINARKKDYKASPEAEIEAFEKAFGKLDENWVSQWKKWMKNVR